MTTTVIADGLGFPESLRMRGGTLWFADWAAGAVLRVGTDRVARPVVRRPSFPLCFDLPPGDGAVLVLSNPDRAILRATSSADSGTGAEPAPWAELGAFGPHPWNELVVAPGGWAYANNIGFDFGSGGAASAAGPVGFVVLARPDGSTAVVADRLTFPNGMAVHGDTLLVAESWGSCITAFDIAADGSLSRRRIWAQTPGLHPDGIDVAADGTVWTADVASRSCVQLAPGGRELGRVHLDRSAYDCVAGELDGAPVLYVAVNDPSADPFTAARGRVVAVALDGPGRMPRGGVPRRGGEA